MPTSPVQSYSAEVQTVPPQAMTFAAGTAVLEGAPEIAASTGSACHEGHESASAVILAMGIEPEEAVGSVRLTLGRGTTENDVVRAAEALVRSWKRLVRQS